MDFKLVAGIDLSKSSFDVFLKCTGKGSSFSNDIKGFKAMWIWLHGQGVDFTKLKFAIEHSGRYGLKLCQFLQQRSCWFTLVSGLAIKRSLGLQRGKTDPIDAKRIAEYGSLFLNKLRASQLPDKAILELKALRSTEQGLVQGRATEKARVKEYTSTKAGDVKLSIEVHQYMIKQFTKQIKKVQSRIKQLIASHQPLKQNFKLLMSISGIGEKTALLLLTVTDNFTRFNSARKFACYSGIAPFPYQSGTSVKGRTKVSHLANKEVKKLLYMCAMSSIQHDEEIKQFYHRKTNEAKHPLSVINAIKNKLVQRVFAVIKRQTPYVDIYGFKA